MTYGETEKVSAPDVMLREAGFSVSKKCCSRPSCFDFAARKNDTLLLVKVQSDIDNLSLSDSEELMAISESVSAASLLIGERTRERPLEDDTVYSRYNVTVVTPKTFESILVQKAYPLIHAGPGGYYVEIDCEVVKRRRLQLGLSVGEMAEMIGISRRTLYGYERGMAKASVASAYNIVYVLGVPIAKPIDIFEKARGQRKCFLASAKFALTKSRLLQRILKKFARCNVMTVKRAPFDFVITVPEEKMRIIGGVADGKENELNRRVDEILSVSKIVRAYPILVTDEKKPSEKNIMCICKDELSQIKNPEDLIVKA